MTTHMQSLVAVAALGMGLSGPVAALAAPNDGDPAAAQRINLGLRGVYFVPNEGQWSDDGVMFGLRSRGLNVAFRESALTMHMAREVAEGGETTEASPTRERGLISDSVGIDPLPGGQRSSEQLTLTVTFPGSNGVLPVGGRPRSAKFNYFVGGEGRGVASGVPSFGEVVYENLYDGVDLHVMGNDDGVMKYEFHVAPGADYGRIRIAYDGIDSLCIGDAGNLHINTSFGTLADGAPVVWQEGEAVQKSDGEMEEFGGQETCATGIASIPARFELVDNQTYRIALNGEIDPTRPLIIDPEVEWMYYLGGSAYDHAYATVFDSLGNMLVTGMTYSPDFVGRTNSPNGDWDAYLLKISADGDLLWMTYLGGSGSDRVNGIALDPSSDIIMVGTTTSDDFPGRLNSHMQTNDAFVLKAAPSGMVVWMRYLGGQRSDYGAGVTIDSQGTILVTGYTESTNFEGRLNEYIGGEWDAFAARITLAGELEWSVYLGGSLDDFGRAVATNAALDTLVIGTTRSTNFAGRTNSPLGARDVFIVSLAPTGALNWMTYFGGSHEDYGYSIESTRTGDVVFAGVTYSLDFVGRLNLHNGGLRDAYVAKAAASGTILWMRYLGGSRWDHGYSLALDDTDYIYVAGETVSTDFTGRDNEYRGGSFDAFVLRTTPEGVMEWMLYLGGFDEDRAWSVAVGDDRRVAVAGWTASPDFQGRRNVLNRNGDAFAVSLRQDASPQLEVDATCPAGGPLRIGWYDATPRGRVGLLFSRREGSTSVPPGRPCAGTVMGLGIGMKLVVTGLTGSSGSATLLGEARLEACGGYMQLLDLTTCAASNVVRIE